MEISADVWALWLGKEFTTFLLFTNIPGEVGAAGEEREVVRCSC